MKVAGSLKHLFESPSRSLANFCYRMREKWRRKTAHLNPNPIFVLGNQKAGTSAITALLGEATGLSYTIDIFCLYEGLEHRLLRGETTFDEVLERGRYYFSKDIIKDPSFTFLYDELVAKFPNSKRVFVLRDPRQNIRSILNRLNLPGHLEDLSMSDWQYVESEFPGWHPILRGNPQDFEEATYIETLASRCREIFHIYFKHKKEIVPVFYETFNQNKVQSIQRLANQLDLQILYSIDHLKDKQFQPKGDKNISIEDFFGSKNLQRIQVICGNEMTALGYNI